MTTGSSNGRLPPQPRQRRARGRAVLLGIRDLGLANRALGLGDVHAEGVREPRGVLVEKDGVLERRQELGHVREYFGRQFGPDHSAEMLRLLRDVLRRRGQWHGA